MKKLVSLLLALVILLSLGTSLAEAQTFTFNGGSTYYGMIHEALPNGFGTYTASADGSVLYGEFKNSEMDGIYFQPEFDEAGAFIALNICEIHENVRTSVYKFTNDAVYLYGHENGVANEVTWVTVAGNLTRGQYKDGEVTGKTLLEAADVQGTPLAYGVPTLGMTENEEYTLLSLSYEAGIAGPAVFLYHDGGVGLMMGFGGLTYYYNPAWDYYYKGTSVDGQWQSDTLICYADGTSKPKN